MSPDPEISSQRIPASLAIEAMTSIGFWFGAAMMALVVLGFVVVVIALNWGRFRKATHRRAKQSALQ